MVVCPRCQAQLSDAYRYCPFCNSEIHPAEMKVAAEPQQVNPQTVELDTSVGQEATPSKNSDADMKTQKQKLFAIGTVIAIIIAIFMGSAISISQRTTYNSEDEMKMAVAGTYTCYDDDGTTHYQLKVENDTVVKRWNYLGSNSDVTLNISAWNPRKGSFEVSLGTIVVTSDGDLKLDGKLYEKGGYWSSTLDKKSYGGLSYNFNSPSYNYSSDNGYSDLKITAASLSSNSSYTICTGSVKNTGTKTYYYVKVKGSFKDSSGNVIDTDWTYAAGSEGLAPGESSKYTLSVSKDYKINSCSVSLLDFD